MGPAVSRCIHKPSGRYLAMVGGHPIAQYIPPQSYHRKGDVARTLHHESMAAPVLTIVHWQSIGRNVPFQLETMSDIMTDCMCGIWIWICTGDIADT